MKDYDLTAWRRKLAYLRTQCLTFEEAWARTVGVTARGGGGEETVLRFIYRHWQAAYTRSPAPMGRWAGGESETGGTGTRVPVSDRQPGPAVCRSGVEGGCRKRATRGRFGPTFCAGHHDELAAIAAKVPGAPPFPAGQPGSYVKRAA